MTAQQIYKPNKLLPEQLQAIENSNPLLKNFTVFLETVIADNPEAEVDSGLLLLAYLTGAGMLSNLYKQQQRYNTKQVTELADVMHTLNEGIDPEDVNT